VQHHADDGEHGGDVAGRAGQPQRVVDPELLHRTRGQGAGDGDQDGTGHAGGRDQPPAT
jgi:hypothetical protein